MKNIFTTTRITGLLYLGLALTGMYAFLFARSKLYIAGDAVGTATKLIMNQDLARLGIGAELALVVFQALVALWFFQLFRKVHLFSAVALATFGTINAVLILISTAFWLGAFMTATGSGTLTPNQTELSFMLFNMHEYLWVVGKLFFGFWLIPMGYLAKKSSMPKILGWILMGGGVGYVLSLFLQILFPTFSASIIEFITIPATIGEFWMIGYLLWKKEVRS